jgi:predicted N-acetyltransferase YhbS
MLSIRTLTEADLDVADTIIRAAYQVTSSRIEAMRKHLLIQAHGWILATLDTEPVGLVGATNYGPFAHVGLMSVLPTVQRQGIGRVLLSHVLSRLEEEQCATVVLDASESGAALYQHFAFVDEDFVGHWSLERARIQNASLPLAGRVLSVGSEHVAELAAFDARYFGADRSSVFSVLLQMHPEAVLVTRDQAGSLTGYLFIQGQTLGPWVAAYADDAEALLTAALASSTLETPLVFTPCANTCAADLLQRYGFRMQRKLRHMRRGKPIPLRDRSKIYGQVSFALG